MGLRLLYGFITSVILWFAIIHFTYMPKDRFLPPSLSIDDISQKTTGYVEQAVESGYGDHWWDGNTGTEWFLDYKFQPTIWVNLPGGAHELQPLTTWQAGRVAIGQDEYKKATPGDPLLISYDPWNPLLNGPSGSGDINLGASWFSPWLWFVFGFIATTILVGEFTKKWIRSDL